MAHLSPSRACFFFFLFFFFLKKPIQTLHQKENYVLQSLPYLVGAFELHYVSAEGLGSGLCKSPGTPLSPSLFLL